MKLYKVHIRGTKIGELTRIENKYGEGYCVAVQAVHYSSTSPNDVLKLFDGDKNQFMFELSGGSTPNPTTPEIEITVKLPLYYMDSAGDKDIVIWGVVYKIDNTLESSF